jgi:hypothetical protein
VLYQLIAGANPFRGQQPSETLHRVVTHVPPGLRSLRPEVGVALEAAIAKALEKDPEKRFDSASAFAAALRAARTWDEAEAASDLQQVIHEDFLGADMPKRMSLDTLQSRDAAWRAAQPTGQRSALSSSPPPARRSSIEPATQTARVVSEPGDGATIQALPSAALIALARAGAHAADAASEIQVAPVAPPARSKRGLLIGGGLVAAALVVAAAAYPLWSARSPEPQPRFLLIEKQADPALPATSAGPVTPIDALSSAAPVLAVSASPVAAGKAARAADAPVSGSSLTAAFQRQRGRVEGCFHAHSSETDEQPQLTVRFQVEPSGVVRSAELQPAALSGSALGGCILSIARSTRFPSSEAAVNFSIPITARKSAR